MSDEESFPCPCCGYIVFSEEPGSYEICPICFWEDDISQLRFPTMAGGANRPSLEEAQKEFVRIGVSEERLAEHVRPVRLGDRRDPSWRALDPSRDVIEVPRPGIDYGSTYPSDSTSLYYWKRRSAG
jgi:hypothetical protein